ncbi:hypothetical protein EMPS_09021 [Entomortierella parvispora]|uniref:Uncharacterized protein n=1 Tax=Entomortierella parvispora TaxID=205924 RepID=A0A9P3HHF2_9FUNG|nr:hypothetical protein EMPS_09021 [Entomortierella parvispora]
MATDTKDRDLCCCCIRLRSAVTAICFIYLILTGASTYQKYSANNTDDSTATTVIFVSCALQILIAVLGLFAALTKSVTITRVYATLWWALTFAVLALSIGSLYLIIKNDKEAIEQECIKDLAPLNGNVVTDDMVNNCYRTSVIVSAVVLGLQFVIMVLIGWVNQRFLTEVEQDAAIDAALKAVDDGEV